MDMTAIQKALTARGLYKGRVDGLNGPETKAAVARFQKSMGLVVDGIAGAKTQAWLNVAMPSHGVEVAPKRQTVSEIGLKALVSREDLRTGAYRDTKGIWTIGVGHTAAAGAPYPRAGMVITREEAIAIFARDLVQYEDVIRDGVTVDLGEHEFDALASICFNIGTGATSGATFIKRINAGDSPARISAAIMMWNKPPEIISRRRAEADQFATPYRVRLPKGRSTDAGPIKL